MSRKEFIGLTYENDRIRMARIRVVKGGLMLMEVDTLDMPLPIEEVKEGSTDDLDFSEDYSDIFEIESPESTESEAFDVESLSEETGMEVDDDFDMTREPVEAESATENEKLLAEYLTQFNGKKIRVGLHIPFGKTTFQYLKNTDPGSMKRSEREDFFHQKLEPIQGEGDVNPDDYAWKMVNETDCLLAYSPHEMDFINLVELAETYHDGKILIQERLPDESIWAGLARVNYELEEDEITGLVAMGRSTSRVVFMKGDEILNVLPIITEGENSDDILNTVFSKILFEIDKGELPKINRLLLVKSARTSERAKAYFQQQFEDVEVDYLKLDQDRVSYADEILNSPEYLQPYLTAIGAAWAASGVDSKSFSDFSVVPEYIREKLRVLKLEWHGILILVLIALTPLFLNTLYQQRSTELENLEREIGLLDNQIEDLRPTATMTQDLLSDITDIQAETERILNLSAYSQKWSQTIELLNEGVFDISTVWLSTLNTADADSNLVFSGQSLTREEIPEFAYLFSNGHILNVTEAEIRGETVYNFSVRVNNILQDLDEFVLPIPEPSFDSEQETEIPLDFSEARPSPDEESSRPIMSSALFEEAEPSSPVEAEAQISDRAGAEERSTPNGLAASNTPRIDRIPEPVVQEQEVGSGRNIEGSNASVSESELTSSYGLMGDGMDMIPGAYTITLHSIVDSLRAQNEYRELQEAGYRATLNRVNVQGTERWRVGVGQFRFVSDAMEAAERLPEPYRNRHFIIDTEGE